MSENNHVREFISKDEVNQIVQRLGAEVSEAYKNIDGDLVVVGLLRGSFIFMADLVREISLPLKVDFLTVSSYGDGTVSTGDVKILMDLDESVEDKHILLVEDIVDTGNTFKKVINMINNRKPASLKTCTFLSKPSRREVEVAVDFCGKTIPDAFVVGYGLDYQQLYRHLPYVGVIGE